MRLLISRILLSNRACCSLAAWYSAFSFKSPWALASAIAAIIFGLFIFFSSSNYFLIFSRPEEVIGSFSIFLFPFS